MRKHSIVSIVILLCAAIHALAQPQLAQDRAWFQQQKKEYQRWLDQSDLGKTLYVHQLDLKEDTLLVLYLAFHKAHPDSAASAWRALSAQCRILGNPSLEIQLFRRAAGCFDIDDDHLALKIYDTYDLNKDYCFKRKIVSVEGLLTIDSASRCKAPVKDDIRIDVGELRTLRGNAKIPVAKRVERNKVFALTKTFLQQRYGAKVCAGRKVQAVFTERGADQQIQVFNLCDEMLKEEQHSLCAALQYFGHDCNWKKNEKITIRLTYQANGKTGFTLELYVSGHYGSGFYETEGRRGYHDMETDFKYELDQYAAGLKLELTEYLRQKL